MAGGQGTSPDGDEGGSTVRNSAIVSIATLASRVTGLLRVVVIGAVLGPTYFGNSFQSTNTVPNIIFSLVAGPVLTMVVVPGLMTVLESCGPQRAQEVYSRVTGWLLSVMAGVMIALVIASPVIAWTLTRAITNEAQRASAMWVTTLLVVLVAPQLLLYCLVHLGISGQRARGRFALSAIAPGIENIILIGVVLLAGWRFGTNLDVDRVPLGMVLTLGIGSTIAVAVHATVQLFGASRVGFTPSPRWWRGDQDAREITQRLTRSVGVAGLPSAAMYVLFALASAVPGGVWVVQMSYQVLYALSYLSARAVSMASLPELARAHSRGDDSAFGQTWRRGLTFAFIASVPLVVLLGGFGGPTATLLAEGKLHHSPLVMPLGMCLSVVALAQLVTGLTDLGTQALYARGDDHMPRVANRVVLLVTVMLGLCTLVIPPTGLRLIALVLAILAGEIVGMTMILSRVRATTGASGFLDLRSVRLTVLAAGVMVPIVAVTGWVESIWRPDQQGATVLVLGVGCAAAVAGYGGLLRWRWRPVR